MDKNYVLSELKSRAPQSFAQLNDAIYSAYLKSIGIEHGIWGIKCPVLIASVDRILEVFPGARIVHLVRDGRDVHLSYRNVRRSGEKWGPNGAIASALYWVDGLRRIESVPEASLFELKYEDVVADPGSELKRLCEFIGISYRPEMAENRQAVDSAKNIVLDQHKDTLHKKVFERLDPKNTEKYRTQMSKLDIWVFECLAGPYLRQYGYPCLYISGATPLLTAFRKFSHMLARQFNDWRYRQRDRIRLERAP